MGTKRWVYLGEDKEGMKNNIAPKFKTEKKHFIACKENILSSIKPNGQQVTAKRYINILILLYDMKNGTSYITIK